MLFFFLYNVEAENLEKSNIENGHEWIDLGLPSGAKWATCNIGADNPEDYGSYYSWGELYTKNMYDWTTYQWCNGTPNFMKKYCSNAEKGVLDKKRVLELQDDVANVNWGGTWHIPSKEEIKELIDYCYWTQTSRKGVAGYLVISQNNNNSIFIPNGGFYTEKGLEGKMKSLRFWSNNITEYGITVVSLLSERDFVGFDVISRYCGLPIRAVCN